MGSTSNQWVPRSLADFRQVELGFYNDIEYIVFYIIGILVHGKLQPRAHPTDSLLSGELKPSRIMIQENLLFEKLDHKVTTRWTWSTDLIWLSWMRTQTISPRQSGVNGKRLHLNHIISVPSNTHSDICYESNTTSLERLPQRWRKMMLNKL